MTSIRTYDPADGSAPPELPPLPIGVLAVAAADLLQQTADLPQPVYITISDTQSVDLLFASVKASVQALNRWAHRFGAIVTSQLGQGNGGTETWYRTDFGYYGIAVTAYAHIPAAPASS
jgi:hypothetical protein